MDEYPNVSGGVFPCDGQDQVGLLVRIEHEFLTSQIPHRKFRLGYLSHAGWCNGVDAEEGFRRYLHGVEEGLIRVSEPVDADEFDLESFSGRNGIEDNVLHTFSGIQIDGCSSLKRSLNRVGDLILVGKRRKCFSCCKMQTRITW